MAGMLLTIVFYAVMAIFLADIVCRVVIYCRGPEGANTDTPPVSGNSPLLLCYMVADVILLRRLLRANPLIWFWEWLFHVSFTLVLIRHLMYFMDPVPDWIVAMQPLGIIAGCTLPFSLLVILCIKLGTANNFFPPYNFFLIVLLLALSATGLLMNFAIKTDLAGIKHFSMGIVTFHPEIVPWSYPFLFHFIIFLIFILYLPSHIFTAPFSILDAQKRDDGLKLVMHEK
jgi:nitrate reductase gamma subunit